MQSEHATRVAACAEALNHALAEAAECGVAMMISVQPVEAAPASSEIGAAPPAHHPGQVVVQCVMTTRLFGADAA